MLGMRRALQAIVQSVRSHTSTRHILRCNEGEDCMSSILICLLARLTQSVRVKSKEPPRFVDGQVQ